MKECWASLGDRPKGGWGQINEPFQILEEVPLSGTLGPKSISREGRLKKGKLCRSCVPELEVVR